MTVEAETTDAEPPYENELQLFCVISNGRITCDEQSAKESKLVGVWRQKENC
jgi:hypothetical protein